MRGTALMMVCVATLACGGGGDQQQTGTAGGQTAAAPDSAAGNPTNAPAQPAGQVSGQSVYGRTCITCHQANGRGMPNAFPPLENSPFVNGDKATLIKLVLNGMTGPLTVNGARFNGVMPPWKSQLNDAEVAAVLTYVRGNFSNTSGAVTAAEVATQRAATAGRNTPFTASELGH